MTKANRLEALLPLLLAAGAGCSSPDSAGAARVTSTETVTPDSLGVVSPIDVVDVCPETVPGQVRCYAKMVVPNKLRPLSSPSGFGPTDLQSAYNFGSVTPPAVAPTVGIIDFYDDPNAEADLAVYRSYYGLSACTTANGCFRKLDQYGNTITGTPTLPAPDVQSAGEISLDIDMVSAVCPTCKILLMEANSGQIEDLGEAVNKAVQLGATVLSNSYGGAESSSDPAYDTAYFEHVGVTIFASAGDSNYAAGVSYPASGAWVIGVGGTSLVKDSSTRGWSEAVWNTKATEGTGSGCSSYTALPAWAGTGAGEPAGCAKKMVGDLSAVADPATGVAVYDTYGAAGWGTYGGTSASSPILASLFARAGIAGVSPGWVWDNKSDFYDVTSGNNGTCTTAFFCTAEVGFDGPTGWGTPNGALLAVVGPQHIKQAFYWAPLMGERQPGLLGGY